MSSLLSNISAGLERKWRGMKIGIDGAPLAGNRTGIGNYASNLLTNILCLREDLHFKVFQKFFWSDEKFESQLLQNQDRGNAPRPAPLLSILKRSNIIKSMYRGVRESAFKLANADVDFFHAFVYRPPAFTGIPFIPVVYDLSHKRFPEHHPAERVRWMDYLDQYLEKVPYIHTISNFTKNEIVEYYGISQNKISVIYPGINPVFLVGSKDHAADLRCLEQLGLSSRSYALSVSTLEPRKNLTTIIDAYSTLPVNLRLEFPLIIVGGQGWGRPLENNKLQKLIDEKSVRFLGYQTDEILKILYSHCRVFCYPSLYEGFGMPIAEAIALSAPVLASKIPVFEEISLDHISFVEARDIDSWANGLKETFETSKLLIPDAGAIRTRFNWRESALKTIQMYDEVADILSIKR